MRLLLSLLLQHRNSIKAVFLTAFIFFPHFLYSHRDSRSDTKYKTACVLPYHWLENGTTLVLLGKEKRLSGDAWLDFCGHVEDRDKDSVQTALREAREETAGQLSFIFVERPCEFARRKHVDYVLPVEYVPIKKIEKAAQSGYFRHIEKTEWKWVRAKDLLHERTGLHLYSPFRQKLRRPAFKEHLSDIIRRGKRHAHKRY